MTNNGEQINTFSSTTEETSNTLSPTTEESNNSTLPRKVFLYKDDWKRIAKLVEKYPEKEVGGDLWGLMRTDGLYNILYTTGPGPKAHGGSFEFTQDKNYQKMLADTLHKRYAIEHIGSWHSHHSLGLTRPSSGDISTFTHSIKTTPNRNSALCIICNIKNRKATLNFYLVEESGRCNICDVEKLQVPNPHYDESIEKEMFDKCQNFTESFWNSSEGSEVMKKAWDQLKVLGDLKFVKLQDSIRIESPKLYIFFA